MRKLIITILVMNLIAGAVSAQDGSHGKQVASTQEVMNTAANRADMMVIKGRIIDAETKQPIVDAKINFDRFGDELVSAAVDKDGNYALALNKRAVGETIRVIFKVDGYQRYIAKSIRSNSSVVGLNLRLWPDDIKQSNATTAKYAAADDASNTLTVKF